ncbi:MAG: ribulose 1,5-bisphosphate carboxylase [Anaerolineae bacterium]|nr:ribulose 1,5-bisphosphate carboxylase [Anaerolineae bacterium]
MSGAPPDDAIRCTYYVESPFPPDKAASVMAATLSAGTFTKVPGETEALTRRFSATVESVCPLDTTTRPALPYGNTPPTDGAPHYRAEVRLRVPLDVTGTDFATVLAVVAGGVTELKELSGVRLMDLDLPHAFAHAHPGPQFGVEGTRRLTNVYNRPLMASIIKPNVGLTPEQTAAIVRTLAEAGVDFVKDDEKMTSPPYSTVAARVQAVMAVIHDVAARTGKQTLYAFNISADDPDTLVRHHDTVLKAGGACVMVNINHIGYAGVKFLRKHSQLPIHAHRNGWGALTRSPFLGMSFNAYNKIWRLVGVDHLHVNGIRNKYWESDESVVNAIGQCLTPLFSPADRLLPVVGSGMWAGQLPDTYRLTQTTDFMYICGGGIQGHPGGPGAGVKSLHQAWEAAMAGITLDDYAATHPELRQALERFGQRKAAS